MAAGLRSYFRPGPLAVSTGAAEIVAGLWLLSCAVPVAVFPPLAWAAPALIPAGLALVLPPAARAAAAFLARGRSPGEEPAPPPPSRTARAALALFAAASIACCLTPIPAGGFSRRAAYSALAVALVYLALRSHGARLPRRITAEFCGGGLIAVSMVLWLPGPELAWMAFSSLSGLLALLGGMHALIRFRGRDRMKTHGFPSPG
jgi:hypothetical protein